MAKTERKHNDWLIIHSVKLFPSSTEIVLGYNENNSVTPYVTWESNNGTDFYWGHYFSDYRQAKYDLLERAELQIQIYKSLIEIDEKSDLELY